MDHISKERRSWNMSRVRSKDTKPEMAVRKYLHSKGIRYRLHTKLPGKPDLTMKGRAIALFVNGCFWHGHTGCQYFRIPKSRVDYWEAKISGNKKRDVRNYATLTNDGWRVIVIWECDLKRDIVSTLEQLYTEIIHLS